jgi:hypothetical protein
MMGERGGEVQGPWRGGGGCQGEAEVRQEGAQVSVVVEVVRRQEWGEW